MASMTSPIPTAQPDQVVIGGIDTHKDIHVAALSDSAGMVLGSAAFPTTQAGYRQLQAWLGRFGTVARVGVEGTGSYGAGICRQLSAAGIEVVEVNRPDRSQRRRRGKSDALDAAAAAEAARTGNRTAIPKSRDGQVEALRVLRLTRASAVKARTKAWQQIDQLLVTGPSRLRDQLRQLTRMKLIRRCAAWRPDSYQAADPAVATRIALQQLARRYLQLDEEISHSDALLEQHRHRIGATADRCRRDRPRDRRPDPGHRRRQPRPGAQRSRVRDAVRGGAAAGFLRQNTTAPAQPGRGPTSQPGHPRHRDHPETLRPSHPGLYEEKTR